MGCNASPAEAKWDCYQDFIHITYDLGNDILVLHVLQALGGWFNGNKPASDQKWKCLPPTPAASVSKSGKYKMNSRQPLSSPFYLDYWYFFWFQKGQMLKGYTDGFV